MKKKIKKQENKKQKFLKTINKLKIKIAAQEKKVSKIEIKIAKLEKKAAEKKAKKQARSSSVQTASTSLNN